MSKGSVSKTNTEIIVKMRHVNLNASEHTRANVHKLPHKGPDSDDTSIQ
jgi:hypothetical protein